MRIGIDVDDTLVNSSKSFENIKKKYNLDFKKTFKDRWTKKEKDYIFDNYLKEILVNVELNEYAKEIIDELVKNGHELFIITARNNMNCDNIEMETINFINRNGIKINKFYFRQSKKSDIAKKLNLDLMIDDSLYVYENMKKENIDCILFGNKVKNWKDVMGYINKNY